MQTITLEGYLAADPSILSAQGSGKKRASFRVLETTRFRRADGAPGERTTGFNCICFNEATTGKYIEAFARKGSRVVIQVSFSTWPWITTRLPLRANDSMYFSAVASLKQMQLKPVVRSPARAAGS